MTKQEMRQQMLRFQHIYNSRLAPSDHILEKDMDFKTFEIDINAPKIR